MHPDSIASSPLPSAGSVHQVAHGVDQAHITQVGRDYHNHFHDGVHVTHRAVPGMVVDECPYPGLPAFGPEHAQWFFGRDGAVAELLRLLDRRLETGGAQVVVAPSGAGKSSLLRAGLLPRLGDQALPGSRTWPKGVFTPTARPLEALTWQFASMTSTPPAQVFDLLVRDPEALVRTLRDRGRALLVVDQFEELFTLCPDEAQRRLFVDVLTGLAAPGEGTAALVVIGVRADFYAACADQPGLRSALQDSPVVVGPMSRTELREAIIHPARAVGLDIEPGLVELLLRDLGADGSGYEAGRLPLLAHALRAAWQERHGATLTVAGYRATGGIERAIAQTADHVHGSLGPAEQRAARSMFLRLVKIGDSTDDTRRRLSRTELVDTADDPPAAAAALAAFTAKRLCTSQQNTVEITHEALIHAWPRLRGWLDHDRAGLLVHQRLNEVASAWEREDRPSDALYRGVVLADAQLVAQKPGVTLTAVEREFLEASGHAQQRSTRRLRRLVTGLAVFLVLSLAASGTAVWYAARADAEQREARSLQLAAQAQQFGETNPRAANLLALAAWHMVETPEARGAVLSSRIRPYRSTAKISDQPLSATAVSVDSKFIAAAGEDGVVRLLLPNGITPLRELHPNIGPITGLAFGFDNALVAVGVGGDARLWTSVHSDTSGLRFTTGHGKVNSVAFDRGGRVFATAGDDGTVRRWALANGRQLGRALTGHEGPVFDVAFQRCEGCVQLASTGRDGTIRRWDQSSGQAIGEPLTTGGQAVHSVAYSTDGTVLAAGGGDQVVRMWDPAGGEQLGTLGDHDLPIVDLKFLDYDKCEASGNSRGCLLTTVGLDSTARVWSIDRSGKMTTSTLEATLETQVSAPLSATFAENGEVLATAHTDGTIGWWSPNHDAFSANGAANDIAFTPDGRHETAVDGRGGLLWEYTSDEGKVITGNTTRVHTDVNYSPSGMRVAKVDNRGWVHVSEPTTDHIRSNDLGFTPTEQPVLAGNAIFGRDDHTLFVGDSAGNVTRWRVDVTAERTTAVKSGHLTTAEGVPAHPGGVCGSAVSPDRTVLVTSGTDQVARLWDAETGKPIGAALTGHEGMICGLAFSHDGKVVATASLDQTVRLWDARTGEPLGAPLTGHTGPVVSVAFSSDGLLASGSYDRTVHVWDVTTPEEPSLWATLTGHRNKVNAVAFRPGTRELHTGSDDRTVQVWDLDFDGVHEKMCATVREDLSSQEFSRLVPGLVPADYRDMCR